jgi:hypothetical protein
LNKLFSKLPAAVHEVANLTKYYIILAEAEIKMLNELTENAGF